MPRGADKEALVDWANSFQFGTVTAFRELGDGKIIRQIVAEIWKKPVPDLPTLKKALYELIEHKLMVVDLELKEIGRKEDVLYQLVQLVLLCVVECDEKNVYITKVGVSVCSGRGWWRKLGGGVGLIGDWK